MHTVCTVPKRASLGAGLAALERALAPGLGLGVGTGLGPWNGLGTGLGPWNGRWDGPRDGPLAIQSSPSLSNAFPSALPASMPAHIAVLDPSWMSRAGRQVHPADMIRESPRPNRIQSASLPPSPSLPLPLPRPLLQSLPLYSAPRMSMVRPEGGSVGAFAKMSAGSSANERDEAMELVGGERDDDDDSKAASAQRGESERAQRKGIGKA